MQNQSRLIRVFCVLNFTCTCYWKNPVHVLLTTDSQSYAENFKSELEADSEPCERCGNVDKLFVDSAEYHRKHFIYKD